MKKVISLLLALAMMFAFAACGSNPTAKTSDDGAKTASDADYIAKKGELVIGMTLFSPMNYYDDKGELIGYETEFAKAVCEKLGVKPKFTEINWDSKEMELSSKNIDCIWNGLTKTDEREANMSLSMPYMANKQVLIVKKDNLSKYENSIDGARVIAEQGSAGEELCQGDEFFKKAKYTAADSQAKALMEVASGISDVAVIDYIMALGSIGEGTDYKDLVVVESKNVGSPEEYTIAFRKGSDFTNKVNDVIKELAQDGTLEKIATKYKIEKLLSVK